jgi:hypothetical protein
MMKQTFQNQTWKTLSVAALAVGLALTVGCNKPEPESGSTLPEAAVNTDVSTKPAKPEMTGLTGRWLRADVGYVLDIRSVAGDGKLDVILSAPRTVQVGKAIASQVSGKTQIEIEIADPALAGCKYTLTFDPVGNRLNGVYFQSALKETSEIFFVRAP